MASTYKTTPDLLTPQRGRRDFGAPRYALLEADDVIPVKDCLVGIDADGYVRPASDYASVAAFMAEFAGVCPNDFDAVGHDRVITIYAIGNFEFNLDAAGVFPAGAAISPYATGGAVQNRTVALADDADEVIGAVARHAPEPTNWKTAEGANSVEVAVRAPRMLDGYIFTPATA